MRSSAHLMLLSVLWEAAACVNLRKIEFDILRSSRPSLFLFTATGCEECDRIQGLLDEAASGVLRTTPIATINCRDEPEACDESQIFAVPTLKFTSGNGELVTYKEATELPAIVRYIERQSGPSVTNLTESNHLAFAASSRVAAIAFLSTPVSQEIRQAFEAVAEKWRTHFSFGSVQGGHGTEPFIAVHSRDRDDIAHYRGKFNADDIEAFLRDATTPLVHEFDPFVHQELTTDGKPLGQIFFKQGNDRDELAKSLSPVAKKFKDQINLVTVRVPDYHEQLEKMHLDKDIEQGFAIADALGRAYPMSSAQVNADEVAKHIEAYLAGAIAPVIKSEAIPESSKELPFLTTLVGSNFDELAFDKSRDVLIGFYVPWSEYCQNLLGVMNELGSMYAESGLSDKIAVAAINVEANDVPIQIDSYPSLRLYRAGTNEVVSFAGDFHEMLTPELLDTFVSSQGKHGVGVFVKDTIDHHEEL